MSGTGPSNGRGGQRNHLTGGLTDQPCSTDGFLLRQKDRARSPAVSAKVERQHAKYERNERQASTEPNPNVDDAEKHPWRRLPAPRRRTSHETNVDVTTTPTPATHCESFGDALLAVAGIAADGAPPSTLPEMTHPSNFPTFFLVRSYVTEFIPRRRRQ